VSEGARGLWQRKLKFLQTEEAKASDAAQRFQLQQDIAEARSKLREFDATDRIEAPRVPPPPSKLTRVGDLLLGRNAELARLDAAWASPESHVLTIVAWGGVGKTALVATWAAGLAAREYDGARYFDWSFFSQGSHAQTAASGDQFIARALAYFGDAAMAQSAASPWDKGARLAQLVVAERTLLVLDGLEPLQHPPGPLAGELRDPAVAALLRGLAQRNPGLCVVTTRERVADLAPFRGSTAPELALHHLTIPAGVELLRTLSVRGTAAECEQLVRDVDGHALTLNLVGRYLVRAHRGDIRRRDRVRFERADAEVQGGHAFKAMAAYERWLGSGGEEGARQLAALRLLGLFDRPADSASLAALRAEPAIAGLTEPIAGIDEERWNLTVASLADLGLVSMHGDATTLGDPTAVLEAHPLIREYFAARVRALNPDGWRAAHGRLYEHLTRSTEHRPGTLEGLQPLYHAVAHGCLAGRHQEACDDVYYDRIRHKSEHFNTKKLGAYGANLAALATFFEHPWQRPSSAISENDQVWLLSVTSFSLRALGRLTEAREPMQVALGGYITREHWEHAAVAAGNLSDLELLLGEVDSARGHANEAVAHADLSKDGFQKIVQ
jgi:hypothetical protein